MALVFFSLSFHFSESLVSEIFRPPAPAPPPPEDTHTYTHPPQSQRHHDRLPATGGGGHPHPPATGCVTSLHHGPHGVPTPTAHAPTPPRGPHAPRGASAWHWHGRGTHAHTPRRPPAGRRVEGGRRHATWRHALHAVTSTRGQAESKHHRNAHRGWPAHALTRFHAPRVCSECSSQIESPPVLSALGVELRCGDGRGIRGSACGLRGGGRAPDSRASGGRGDSATPAPAAVVA